MTPVNSPLAVWARRICVGVQPVDDMLGRAEAARLQNRDCHFLLGSQLTKTRQAYLVYLVGCELFSFCLTDEQTRTEGANGRGLWAFIDGPRAIPSPGLPLHLHQIEIEREQNLKLGEAISGCCNVRSESTSLTNFCLRIQTILRVRNSPAKIFQFRYFHLAVLQGERLKFQFDAMRAPFDTTDYVSPQSAAIFFRFETLPDPMMKVILPLSNVAGTIATFI